MTTKLTPHGLMYRFVIRYKDKHDEACPVMNWVVWAYDVAHAEEKFLDDEDDGWEILTITRTT